MLTARRLLIGGGASLVLPGMFSLGATGFWNNVAEPRAVTYSGKTYVAWIDDAGNAKVASVDNATHAVSAPFTLATGLSSPSGNIHNSVALCVRASDHRILAAWCEEGDANMHFRLSTNPEDATTWGTAYAPVTGDFTYAALYQLASGAMYVLTRNTAGPPYDLAISSSIDGGATWDAGATSILRAVTGAGNPSGANYWRIGVSGNRLHIFATDTDRLVTNPSSVYHLYFEAGVMYKSDGTSLGSGWPIAVTSGTLVQDDSLGTCWAEGWSVSGGNPAAVLLAWDGTKNLIRAARWTGAAWSVSAVADSAGIVDSNKFVAGAAIDKTDPDTIYANRKVGSRFELFRYTSPDGGATWDAAQLTSSSVADNAMPDTPLDAASGLRVTWGQGTYTSDAAFSFDVKGYG